MSQNDCMTDDVSERVVDRSEADIIWFRASCVGLMVIPYVAFLAIVGVLIVEGGFSAIALPISLAIAGVGFVVSMVFAIILAIRMACSGLTGVQMLRWAMIAKLANVPIQIVVGGLTVICFLMIIFTLPLVIIFMAYLYLLILPSSVLLVVAFIRARREGLLTTAEAVIGIIALWFLFFDMLAAVINFAIAWSKSVERAAVR